MKLQNRVAIVTGGGRGIGRAIATLFAREGAAVAVAARTLTQVNDAVEEITQNGGRAIGTKADVTVEEDVRALVNLTLEKFGRIDILVNNAGIMESGPLVTVDPADWRRVIEVNLIGMFLCSKAVAPHMISAGWGRIINMASGSGKIGYPFLSAYCASKHGVVGLTKSLGKELSVFHITVNAICPGVVKTDMVSETVREQAGDKIIKPSEIAALALYLTSDEAGAVNGEAINIFGGTKLKLAME